ncbi:GNAT family N-acetyltransferase [Peribacillus cavernae]|nr:GNAT family N-acetyltransferase [Peribacillus cavernae]MDQ0218663.1 putative GNAT superfamily acetyltransferase [Peribacillus cavernae]
MSAAIEIRTLTDVTDLMLVQLLEKKIWNMDPLPLHQTITASQNGGLLLGAFLKDGMVGFSYSFAGFAKGQSYLCSHMLGIDPNHQEKGIGAILKQEQKKIAKEIGYDLITWTYDPLESRNAYLNVSKLQAICSAYLENCYGDMEDSLNHGLPSDRLKVEWWINSPHVLEPLTIQADQALSIFQSETTEEGLPELIHIEDSLRNITGSDVPILVPIPANFQDIKRKNPSLAIDWRFRTRYIFESLFAQGYAIVSLLKRKEGTVHDYLFVKKHVLNLNQVKRR